MPTEQRNNRPIDEQVPDWDRYIFNYELVGEDMERIWEDIKRTIYVGKINEQE